MQNILTISLTIGTAIATFVATVIYLVQRNARLSDTAKELEDRVQGATMLKHAIKHVATLGTGQHYEYSLALNILEMALYRVIYEVEQ